MTVSSETSRVVYVGDGDTGPFSIPFYFIANADIKAVKVLIADGTETALVIDTDFTLEGAGEADGGTLTLVESIDSTYRLVIFRDPAPLQETAYPPNDPFPSESHERVVDRLTMLVQRILSLGERSVRQPDGDSADIEALPAAVERASKYLAFDADGNPVATSGTGESAVISTFAETLLDDEDAAAFLATLEVSAFFQTLLNDADADAVVETLADGATAETAPAVGDFVLISDASANDGRKMTLADLLKVINVLTTETGIVSGDRLVFYDADAAAVRNIPPGNLIQAFAATQAEMESATTNGSIVTPGRQQFHPGHPKFWAFATVSGGTPTLQTSYNVTSITDTDTGQLTVTIATDFSSANWASLTSVDADVSNARYHSTDSKEAGSVIATCKSSTPAAVDPDAWSIAGFGDQA